MTIKAGDRLPTATLYVMTDGTPEARTADDLFKGKRVAFFGVPGAFTPTCSAQHLPGFIEKAAALKEKGIERIICFAVNDAFVMDAWGKDHNAGDAVMMVADGSADFTRAAGLEMDLSKRGMGLRCQRFSMVVEDGTVKSINIDPAGELDETSAEKMLEKLS